jgi:hypothetical protein
MERTSILFWHKRAPLTYPAMRSILGPLCLKSGFDCALQGNVNAVSVAKNAGTSIDMIEKFYDHSLSTGYISELTKFDVTGADAR